MQRSVVTQVQFRELKFYLDALADNLSFHVNASLAKAHGINLLSGLIDVYGNDLTTYQDSAGNIWGNRFLRISTAIAVFYAPATVVDSVAVPGKPATTGKVDANFGTPFKAVGSTSWVTQFLADDITNTRTINDDYLIPHTNLAHWETHGAVETAVKTTLDTSGNTVGTHVARFSIDGIVYEVPCSSRFGGPAQAARNATITPTVASAKDDSLPLPSRIYTFHFGQGTKPYAITWQVNDQPNGSSNTWLDMTGLDGSITTIGNGFVIQYFNADTTAITIRAHSINGIDNRWVRPAFTIRVKITNAGGDGFSSTARYDAYDETDSCPLYSSAFSAGYLTEADFFVMLRYQLRCSQKERLGWENWAGYMTLLRPVAKHVRKGTLLGRLAVSWLAVPNKNYAQWRLGERPFNLGHFIVAKLFKAANVIAYFCSRKKSEKYARALQGIGLLKLYRERVKEVRLKNRLSAKK